MGKADGARIGTGPFWGSLVLARSPQPLFRSRRRRDGLKLFVLAGAAVVCAGIVRLADPALTNEASPPATPWSTWFLNVLPVWLALATLACVTARAYFSSLVVPAALWALYAANDVKLHELGSSVVPGDFILLGNLGTRGVSLLLRYLSNEGWQIAAMFGAVILLAWLAWKERPLNLLRGWRRPVAAVIACALSASLAVGLSPWRAAYGNDEFMAWAPARQAEKNGLVAHLLRYQWEMAATMPEPNLAAAAALIERHGIDAPPAASDASADAPDIVIVQSESLFDPARLNGIDEAQVLPNLRALSAVSQHGNLWIPTFGGGTIRTEFEVLTGIAMRYFPLVQYPYFGMTATREASIASVLAEHGYDTLVVHPYDRGFWNRASALSNLGFDEFDAQEDFGDAPRQGFYISDDALTDHILDRLGKAKKPMLVLAISMENHGPYDDYPNVDTARRDAIPTPPMLGDAARRELRGYLYHAGNADRALGKLADALRQRQRRTLLLFYGDHLPALADVYAQAGFKDGVPAAQQPVPWLLFDTARQDARPAVATATFYLPALLLEAAGVRDDAYFRLLEDVRAADQVGPEWTPVDDVSLSAIMQLRQRRQFAEFAHDIARNNALGAALPATAAAKEP